MVVEELVVEEELVVGAYGEAHPFLVFARPWSQIRSTTNLIAAVVMVKEP